jgi:dihydrofolate reductase
MRKLVSFMHISVDGFATRTNGSMDWIKIGDEMFEYARVRTEQSDAALYGRKTFELMDAYWQQRRINQTLPDMIMNMPPGIKR